MDQNGFVELSVDGDEMIARADFFPPSGKGVPLSPDYVDTLLESDGIVHGLDEEAISEAVFFVNTERRATEGVVVARGTTPKAARPPFYRVLEESPNRPEAGGDASRVDYKGLSRIPIVHAGDIIARLVPAEDGVSGMTVRGAEIPFETIDIEELSPGKNTHIADTDVVAEVGGLLMSSDGRFFVEDRLEIDGDVGYGTGSIEFPGDVVLKGEIKDGFHVWAGGSVTSSTTVDVSEIYCREEFSSTGGLVGRGKALLRCGGKVQVRFVGNCYVESKSSVYVKQYVYHSHIGCRDRFATGKKGQIIGGIITAVNGLRCATLGNDVNIPTHIRVGIDFIVERKLRLIKEKFVTLKLRTQKLIDNLGDDPTDRQIDILQRLEDSRNRLATQMGELATVLDTNEEAEVIVDGAVFPGVHIQICRASYQVVEVLSHVRFVLEKSTGRIVPKPLDDR